MAILELVQPRPDWMGALGIGLTRPPGVPERRSNENPGDTEAVRADRPRRISDDLAWFRQVLDDPAEAGLKALDETASVAAWDCGDKELTQRLTRLDDRGILDAAGLLLHDPDMAVVGDRRIARRPGVAP